MQVSSKVSQIVSRIAGGKPGFSVCGRVGYSAYMRGNRVSMRAANIIDAIVEEQGHCYNAMLNSLERNAHHVDQDYRRRHGGRSIYD